MSAPASSRLQMSAPASTSFLMSATPPGLLVTPHSLTMSMTSPLCALVVTASPPDLFRMIPGHLLTLTMAPDYLRTPSSSSSLLMMPPIAPSFPLMMWLSLGLRLPQMKDGPRGKAPSLCFRVFPAPGEAGNER